MYKQKSKTKLSLYSKRAYSHKRVENRSIAAE